MRKMRRSEGGHECNRKVVPLFKEVRARLPALRAGVVSAQNFEQRRQWWGHQVGVRIGHFVEVVDEAIDNVWVVRGDVETGVRAVILVVSVINP